MRARLAINRMHLIYFLVCSMYVIAYFKTYAYGDLSTPKTALILGGIILLCTLSLYLALASYHIPISNVLVGVAYCGPVGYLAYIFKGDFSLKVFIWIYIGVFIFGVTLKSTIWFVSGFLLGYAMRLTSVWMDIYHNMESTVPSIASEYSFVKTWTSINASLGRVWLPFEIGAITLLCYYFVSWIARRVDSPLDRVV